jgi:hypothetical protein
MPKQIIVKVQLPLAGDQTRALVYNQDRSVIQMLPISPELLDKFGPEEVKAYCYAEVDRDGFVLMGRAPDQAW